MPLFDELLNLLEEVDRDALTSYPKVKHVCENRDALLKNQAELIQAQDETIQSLRAEVDEFRAKVANLDDYVSRWEKWKAEHWDAERGMSKKAVEALAEKSAEIESLEAEIESLRQMQDSAEDCQREGEVKVKVSGINLDQIRIDPLAVKPIQVDVSFQRGRWALDRRQRRVIGFALMLFVLLAVFPPWARIFPQGVKSFVGYSWWFEPPAPHDECCYSIDFSHEAMELILPVAIVLLAIVSLRGAIKPTTAPATARPMRAYAPSRQGEKQWVEQYRWSGVGTGYWLHDRAGKIYAKVAKEQDGTWRISRETDEYLPGLPSQGEMQGKYTSCAAAQAIAKPPYWGWLNRGSAHPTEQGKAPTDPDGAPTSYGRCRGCGCPIGDGIEYCFECVTSPET